MAKVTIQYWAAAKEAAGRSAAADLVLPEAAVVEVLPQVAGG